MIVKDARSAEMLALRRQGMTLRQIGDRFGLTREQVRGSVAYADRMERRPKPGAALDQTEDLPA